MVSLCNDDDNNNECETLRNMTPCTPLTLLTQSGQERKASIYTSISCSLFTPVTPNVCGQILCKYVNISLFTTEIKTSPICLSVCMSVLWFLDSRLFHIATRPPLGDLSGRVSGRGSF